MLLTALLGRTISQPRDFRDPPIFTTWNMEQTSKIKHLRKIKWEQKSEQGWNMV